MPFTFAPTGGGGPIANPTASYFWLGRDGTGAGTPVVSGAAWSVGTWTLLGIAPDAFSELTLMAIAGGSTGQTNRFTCEVSLDDTITTHAADLVIHPGLGTSGVVSKYRLKVKGAAGAKVWVRLRASGAGLQLGMMARFTVAAPDAQPGYGLIKPLNISTAVNAVRAVPDVPVGGAITELATLSESVAGLMLIIDWNGSPPTKTQGIDVSILAGATAGSAVELFADWAVSAAANPGLKTAGSFLWENTLPAGTKLWAKAVAVDAGDAITAGLWTLH